jgi:hypothetical protein
LFRSNQRLNRSDAGFEAPKGTGGQEEQIAALRADLGDAPEGYFSVDEAAALRQRLEDLERRLTENLTQHVKDKSDLATRLAAVSADITMLKETMEAVPKSGWVNAVCSRAFGWLTDPINRKLITSGAQVAKDLLIEAHKTTAPGN